MRKKAILALLALVLLPLASAQTGDLSVSITDPLAGGIDALGSTDLNFSLTVSCDVILEAGGSATFTVATDLPEDFGAESKDVTVDDLPGCVGGGGSKTVTGMLSITPVEGAMANNKTGFQITATDASLSASDDNGDQIWIGYVPGHELDPEPDFPYTLTADDGDAFVFNVTVTVTANSDTMVMFMEPTASVGGVSGFGAEIFNLKDGDERTRVKTVTYTPPSGDWDNATIEFLNLSHCLDQGIDCPTQLHENITWTIINGRGSDNAGGGGGGEDSPGAGSLSLLLALAAAAFVAKRRR